MTTENILDKVRKLLRLAGNNTAPEEAASAAAMAQELLDRHNLDTAMLEFTDAEPTPSLDEPIQNFADAPLDNGGGSSQLERWKGYLAMTIAAANACKVWRSGPRLMLIGRPSDAETVRYLFGWLSREVEQLATRFGQGQGRTWRNNFRLGVVETIASKLEDQHKVFEQTVRAEARDNSQALVRVNQGLAKVEARKASVEVWQKTHVKLRKGSPTKIRFNSGAREAGRKAGESINVTGGKTRLTSGAKTLKS